MGGRGVLVDRHVLTRRNETDQLIHAYFVPQQRLKTVLWVLHRMSGAKSQERANIYWYCRVAAEFAACQRRYPTNVSPFEDVLPPAHDQVSDADFAKDFHCARV